MILQEIQVNAEDLAGGELVRQKLDKNFATLMTLNVLDTMMLEMSNTRKQFRGYKIPLTLAANVDTGTIAVDVLNLDSKFIRYRENVNSYWRFLDVVEEIEDLTRKTNYAQRAILFQGVVSPLTYFLSWKPDAAIEAELWGKQISPEITDLNDFPPFPPEFSMVAAYRIADFVLNQLLLMDAKAYGNFVLAQKGSIQRDQERCEFVWLCYRARVADSSTRAFGTEYNVLNDLAGFDDGTEDFQHYLG